MKDPRISELKNLRTDIAAMGAVQRRLIARESALMEEMVESALIDEWHRPTREQMDIATKYCVASPVGFCVFHGVRDPKHAECFFCHSSEEDVTDDASHTAGNP